MDKNQILYEDKDIIVCYKPSGIAVQTAKIGQQDMVSAITNYLSAELVEADVAHLPSNGKPRSIPYIGVIHRLDQPVEGIIVFAKNQNAAGELSRQVAQGEMGKHYYAIISDRSLSGTSGRALRGTLIDYLYKDARTNTSFVVVSGKKGAKRAELAYEILDRIQEEGIALAKIELVTGRHHQIRVQMSHADMSLLGDFKYADVDTKELSERFGQKQIALCAYELTFRHPVTKEKMSFRKEPEGMLFQKFYRKTS